MARELNENFFSKPPKESAGELTLKEWSELKSDITALQLTVKNSQGGVLFIYSKMVQLFDKIQTQINALKKQQAKTERYFSESILAVRKEISNQNKDQEKVIAEKVMNLLERHKKMNEKYSYQLQDLCRSFTLQSEQVWSLAGQVKEIKEELSTPDSSEEKDNQQPS